MKKETLYALLTLLLLCVQLTAQERKIVQGVCKDENGKAVENVSVYVHDSLLVSVTDEKGRFTYYHANAGERLRFAHRVFDPTYYTIKEKDIITGKMKDREVYDVISMVTGVKYTIPTGWANEYDTLEEANKHSHISGRYGGKMSDLIGRKYWPRDNSYILDFEGNWKSLIRQECEIVSVPFKEKTYDKYFSKTGDQERTFILVKYEDKVYRVLFEEWALTDPL